MGQVWVQLESQGQCLARPPNSAACGGAGGTESLSGRLVREGHLLSPRTQGSQYPRHLPPAASVSWPGPSMQSPLTRMLWRLKTLCRWRGGVCSEFTGDGYSIGLVSVGELAHRPSGTYSGEAEEHRHGDKARRWTVSCYEHEHRETVQELHERNRTCAPGAYTEQSVGIPLVVFGRHGGATYRALSWLEVSTDVVAVLSSNSPPRDAVHTVGPRVALTYDYISSFRTLQGRSSSCQKLIDTVDPQACVCIGFPDGSVVKNLPTTQETWVQSWGWKDPLEKEMATHSSILAWEIPRTEEPGRLQSVRMQKSWTWLSN